MRNLQAIGDDLEALDVRLSEAGGDIDAEREAGEALGAWFDALTTESWGAVDRAVVWLKDLEVRAAAKRAEVASLTRAAQADEERADRVRARLLEFVRRRGGRFTTPLRTLRAQGNGGVRPLTLLVEAEDLPEEFCDVCTVYAPRKDEIRRRLEAGEDLPFAVLEERGVQLRIG
jgi:hypothetical protein